MKSVGYRADRRQNLALNNSLAAEETKILVPSAGQGLEGAAGFVSDMRAHGDPPFGGRAVRLPRDGLARDHALRPDEAGLGLATGIGVLGDDRGVERFLRSYLSAGGRRAETS